MSGGRDLATSCLAAALGASGLILMASACGGGDGTPASSSASATAAVSTTAPGDDALCGLLPEAAINSVTGYTVTLIQPHNGPGFLHFCTIYLNVAGCEMACALSLEDLGEIDASNGNTPDAYRQSFLSGNPEVTASFKDGVVGDSSWLAVAVSGPLPGWKLAYFQAKGRAYDLGSPRSESGVLSEDQMIRLARAVVSNVR
jgi:hypothetical protein